MSSLKQIEANRSNATKSTGPRTEEGKVIVSLNARKHGVLSAEAVIPGEDHTQFESFRADLFTGLSPQGALEQTLADRIVSLNWRLQRVGKMETAVLSWQCYSEMEDRAKREADSYTDKLGLDDILNSFSKDKIIIKDKVLHRDAIQRLAEYKSLRESEFPSSGMTYLKRTAALGLINRYETSIERSLYKALHELERLQARRAGINVPVPITVDVHGHDE